MHFFGHKKRPFSALEEAASHVGLDADQLQIRVDELIFDIVKRGRYRLDRFADLFHAYCAQRQQAAKASVFLDWLDGHVNRCDFRPEFYFRILSEHPDFVPLAKARHSRFDPKPDSLSLN